MNNTHNEVRQYSCYINRTSHRSLEAALRPLDAVGHMDGVAQVHEIVSHYIYVAGVLVYLPSDHLAPFDSHRIDLP